MGDIILSVFILLTLGLSPMVIKVFSGFRPLSFWRTSFLFWFFMWSAFGVVAGVMNYEDNNIDWFSPVFFFLQSVACIMILFNLKKGIYLFIFTLIFQIPILESFGFRYHSQTVMSINIYFDWVHNFDIEPGSYFILIMEPPSKGALSVADGLNLFPMLIIFFISKLFKYNNHA
jgi:hypothetical protein